MGKSGNQKNDEGIVEKIQRRAKSARNASRFVLWVLLALTVAGIALFYWIPAVSQKNTYSEILKEKIDGLKVEFSPQQNQYTSTEREEISKLLNEIDEISTKIERGQFGITLNENDIKNLPKLDSLLRDGKRVRSAFIDRLNEIQSSVAEADVKQWEFIQDLSIRIGSIILFLFFAQILVRIYRYQVSVARILYNRADILMLFLDGKISEKSLRNYLGLLIKDDFEFGKPRVPYSDVSGISSLIDQLKK